MLRKTDGLNKINLIFLWGKNILRNYHRLTYSTSRGREQTSFHHLGSSLPSHLRKMTGIGRSPPAQGGLIKNTERGLRCKSCSLQCVKRFPLSKGQICHSNRICLGPKDFYLPSQFAYMHINLYNMQLNFVVLTSPLFNAKEILSVQTYSVTACLFGGRAVISPTPLIWKNFLGD